MTLRTVSLRIDAPTGAPSPGRGFYQREDETLYVQVGEFSKERNFFSYLESESEQIRFDIDRDGRLMLIEVDIPRRHWAVDPDLTAPSIAEPADIRWLDFRARILDPTVVTNRDRTLLTLRFAESGSWRWYQLTDSLLLQVDASNNLAAVIVTSIENDFAGRRLAEFRKLLRRRAESDERDGRLPSQAESA